MGGDMISLGYVCGLPHMSRKLAQLWGHMWRAHMSGFMFFREELRGKLAKYRKIPGGLGAYFDTWCGKLPGSIETHVKGSDVKFYVFLSRTEGDICKIHPRCVGKS